MIASPEIKPDPQILRIFISYASEDVVIATALAKCLRDALGDVFAEISIDRWFLQAGTEFKRQIEATLEKTNIFISLHTSLNKQWPAWEVGFFEHVMRGSTTKRVLVPIFQEAAPSTVAAYQGIGLHIMPEQLQRSLEQFDIVIGQVNAEDPMCQFLSGMQDTIDVYRKEGGYPKAKRTEENDPVQCVRLLKLQIFNHLKTTVEETIRPQKQLRICTTGASLERADLDLPGDAKIVPEGQANPMSSIFGLSDTVRTWRAFVDETTTNEHGESWRSAIVSVITSSFPSRIDVDNSQIVVSNDNAKTYRVILSSTIKYYDDKREFNLYFVESLPRTAHGDELTTMLLRALELACRLRFMFFEETSPFSAFRVKFATTVGLPALAEQILRELNLIRKDARDVGLNDASKWLKFVERKDLANVAEIYKVAGGALRAVINRMLEAKGNTESLNSMQAELVGALEQMRESVEPGNLQLIEQMMDRLRAATVGRKPEPSLCK